MSTDDTTKPNTQERAGGAVASDASGASASPIRSGPDFAKLGLFVVILAVAAAFPFVVDDTATIRMISLGIIMAIGAMGLNVLTGYTGQISIGHAAFYGIGAYVTANLMIEQKLTFLATLPASIIITGVAGALVGLPALRVKGPALALVTLGLAILVPTLLHKFGSSSGVALWKPKRSHLGSPVDGLTNTQWQYIVPLIALVAVFLITRNIVHSRAGRALIAVRDQEIAATTAGINVAATKITAFAISAAYCGLAGSLSVLVRGQADASSALAYFQLSIYFLVAVVVGGAATIAGPILGGLLVQILIDKAPEWSSGRVGMAPFILGAALIVIAYFLPGGLLGGLRSLKHKLSRSPN